MAFQLSTYDLPTLYNYASALKRWEDTKPIRGRSEDVRPLGSRKKTHVIIGKDAATGDVFVQLYRTRVLTYHPNGDLTLGTGGWSSPSTFGLIRAVAPYDIDIKTVQNTVWVQAYHNFERGWFKMNGTTMTLTPKEDAAGYARYHVVNPVPSYARKVNRKGMNALRKRFAALYDFTNAYIKLMWTSFDGPDAARIRKSDAERVPWSRSPFDLEVTDDPVLLRAQMVKIAKRYSNSSYIYGAGRQNPRLAEMSVYTIRRVHIDKALRAQFPNEAYVLAEVPLGVIARDAD